MNEKGVNKFSEVWAEFFGDFRVELLTEAIERIEKVDSNRPCVFLSHKSVDKIAAKKVAEYISNLGIDYYLDSEDPNLQSVVRAGNDALVSQFIDLGIRRCSHLLIILSDKTWE